jgi:hypothetical protein
VISQLVEALEEIQANTLKHVGTIFGRGTKAARHGVDEPLVPCDQLRPAALLSAEAGFNELPVRPVHAA